MRLTDKKRRQIILASVQEFKEKGFNGTSMDNVAQRAEVSKRTVYNHFESKDALFFGIVEYMFSLVAATGPAPYSREKPFIDQLSDITTTKINLFGSDDFLDISRVVFPEAVLHPEKMQQAMGLLAEIENNMERWFAAAIEDGKLNAANEKEACEHFMRLVKMDTLWPRLLKGHALTAKDKKQAVDKLVTMYLAYFGTEN